MTIEDDIQILEAFEEHYGSVDNFAYEPIRRVIAELRRLQKLEQNLKEFAADSDIWSSPSDREMIYALVYNKAVPE